MKFLLHIFVLVLLGASAVFPQTPQPTSTPVEDNDVVKISTTLIQIDATVTDSRGRIVTDLKAKDFEVFENGEKQVITNFSFVSATKNRNKITTKKSKEGRAIPVPYPASIGRDQINRTIALVVDDLTLSVASMNTVRRGLRKYVNEEMVPGDFVAIIKTGGGSGVLQQFTSDKRRLNAVIDRLRWNPNGVGGIDAFAPIGGISGIPGREDVIPNLFRSLKNLIRSMKSLPGRKSVMLLSDGFSLTVDPALELETEIRNEGDTTVSRDLGVAKELIMLANRSSVVIYTIDARGVQYTGLTAADNTTVITGVPTANPTLRSTISGRRDILANTRAGLKYIAEQTGGFAIVNTNDIGRGIRRVAQDQSYYLIAYQPEEETFDPETRRFHTLKIKVKRKGLKVRYRSGFFGVSKVDDDKIPDKTNELAIVTAIKSPFSISDINLQLNALFAVDKQNQMLIRSFLHIDANDLKFTVEPDGKKSTAIEILAANVSANGDIEDQFSKIHKITVSEKRYEVIKREGLIYYFVFPIKRDGGYEMRVALRDTVSGKTGTASKFIKIPKLKEKRLTLSGIVLENLTSDQWRTRQQADSGTTSTSTPLLDNAVRRFRRDSVMIYGFETYNVNKGNTGKPQLLLRTRLFYEGKLIHEGKDLPINITNENAGVWSASAALNLHTQLKLGAYILQIVVTDELAKRKRKIATQFVQFEIVE